MCQTSGCQKRIIKRDLSNKICQRIDNKLLPFHEKTCEREGALSTLLPAIKK